MRTALGVVGAVAKNIQVGCGPGVFATERCTKAYPNVTNDDRGGLVGEVEVISLLSLIGELGNKLPSEKLRWDFKGLDVVAELGQKCLRRANNPARSQLGYEIFEAFGSRRG